ncbi:MAG TPA: NUDIX hydrolase [Solirubrobacteraceae bacterium]|nr:NUDIX hydrolase [Solirubrobacteraceae bacterium]
MVDQSGILARGPWDPEDVEVRWRSEPYDVPPQTTADADRALEELKGRGSPSHDGLAARLRDFEVSPDGKLRLDCEPVRWALRLLPGADGADSLSALCVVRDAEGRWLAGRRAAWLATWARRWALGAAGSVEVDENPAATLARELSEEWSVTAERLTVEALIRLPTRITMLVGQAWLAAGAQVTPDAEHDEFEWWPADPGQWPAHADEPLRLTAALLTS